MDVVQSISPWQYLCRHLPPQIRSPIAHENQTHIELITFRSTANRVNFITDRSPAPGPERDNNIYEQLQLAFCLLLFCYFLVNLTETAWPVLMICSQTTSFDEKRCFAVTTIPLRHWGVTLSITLLLWGESI
jgi:hypothetical protein